MYFHLAEQKGDMVHPFAFMATYARGHGEHGRVAAMFGIDLVDALPAAASTASPACPAKHVRVGREHLKVLGLPSRTIDAWLREGVLVKTDECQIYERTPEADRRIADMLAR